MIETKININNHALKANPSWDRAPARIKVVGIGGGGCNCVRRMLDHYVPGVQYVMVNTDIKSLESVAHVTEVVQIGQKATRGWGAGDRGRAVAGQEKRRERVGGRAQVLPQEIMMS